MLIATYSIGFAKKQYIKANEQQGVLKYYLSNHLWFLVVCMFVWSVFLMNNYYNMYLNSIEDLDPVQTYVPFDELLYRID